MKKRILFVIDSLICAGAEKSLITLLSLIDYSRYDVDLQLFKYGGEFEKYLNKNVNLLPPFQYTTFIEKSLSKQLFSLIHIKNIKMFLMRILYSTLLRVNHQLNNAMIARIYWQTIGNCIEKSPISYDYAIAYAQGVPTFYVIDKVHAKKKIGWVNAIYKLNGKEKEFQLNYYYKLYKIITVSDSVLNVFSEVFPTLKKNMTTIWDITDYNFILYMSQEGISYTDNYIGKRILTVGRLNKYHKGYDIALKVCKILKEKGLDFRWYAIGKGPYREEMERYIKENGLEKHFILLGTTPNPYPFFKDAYLYVQTSRHEGFGLTIAEARLLNIPVVTTEFDAVYNQMIQGKNGIVTKQDPQMVAEAIEKLLNDSNLYQSIKKFLEKEKKGNTEEINKFYDLIG